MIPEEGGDGYTMTDYQQLAKDLLRALEDLHDAVEGYYDGAPDSPTRAMGHDLQVARLAIGQAKTQLNKETA